jgi:hypothetical protein
MSPNHSPGTVAVPLSIKPADQCRVWWPTVFEAAGWRVFAKRCTEEGALRRDWLAKNQEHVFAFRQFDELPCRQELQLPPARAKSLLELLDRAGLLQH